MNSISAKYLKTAGIVWVICITGFVLIYFFVISPQSSNLERLRSENEKWQQQSGTVRQGVNESTKEELQKQIEDFQQQLHNFTVLSKDGIQNLAFVEILNISKEMGLVGFNIDPWSEGRITAFSECKYVFGQPMKVSFNATFHDFAVFLNALERHKTVVFIDSFTITKAKDEGLKPSVNMRLAILVQKEAETTDAKTNVAGI